MKNIKCDDFRVDKKIKLSDIPTVYNVDTSEKKKSKALEKTR